MRVHSLVLVAAASLAAPTTAGAAQELIGTCNQELCVAAPGGVPTTVTTDGATSSYSSVSASADGQRITYVRPGGLWRAGPRNTAPEELLAVDAGDTRESAVSADGQTFAFRTFDGNFNGFQSSVRIGGAQGSFLWSSSSRVAVPGFIGNTLVLAQTADGQPKEVVCRAALIPDGPPPCGQVFAADPARDVGSPSASPDEKLVAATATDSDASPSTTLIALFDATTGARLRDLTTGPSDFAPSFSPDGTQVAFTRGNDTLVVATAGGEPRTLVAGMSGASWYQAPDAPAPPTVPGATTAPGGSPGRPAAPASKLKVKGRRLTVKVRCAAMAGCAKTTWTFKQGKRTRLVVKVPALKAGAKRTLKVKLSRATARRIGRKGLRLRLSGKGLKTKTVRLVRG